MGPSNTQHENELLKKLEEEKKLLLRQKRLQLKKETGITTPTSQQQESVPLLATTGNPVTHPEFQHEPSILGGEHVDSPPQMEVDDAKPESGVVTPQPNVVDMPKRPPVQLRATLNRALASTESTRPPTPSEQGPKRGIKRPKADDFVEENMPAKKSARLNGAANLPPPKRSSFAIANSAPPEQLIITWVDDEGVEGPTLLPWNQPKEHSTTNVARDSEAAQLAAAAMALGLPMTAEELEAARLQEEERRAQINVKAERLYRTRANLKRLELKKAEKNLLTLQGMQDQSAILSEVCLVPACLI